MQTHTAPSRVLIVNDEPVEDWLNNAKGLSANHPSHPC